MPEQEALTTDTRSRVQPEKGAVPPTGAGIAVIIPCFNEEKTVAQVVSDFRKALPLAQIYVYDNNSSDRTSAVATAAGAIVRSETRQGKGNVVRRMFADVDAEVYVLVDGDGTYDAAAAPAMVAMLVGEQLDMVVGCRAGHTEAAYRLGHQLGNAMFTAFLRTMFGRAFTDILSGYRVFSRRFVKSFPSLSSGFEIETEIAVHSLSLRMPVGEMSTRYGCRPEGSASKLNTYRDGLRILAAMVSLFRLERPAVFFGAVAATLAIISAGIAVPIFLEYFATGLVPRLPTAVLSTGLMILAMLSLMSGLILDTVTRGRRETRRLAYIAQSSPGA